VVEQPGARNERRASSRPPTDHGHATDTGAAEPPRLFGREFRFFPDVGSAGIWGLHVWVWRHNPHGLYANLNPRVSCEHADMDHSSMDHEAMDH
jgi:hypothetical protein